MLKPISVFRLLIGFGVLLATGLGAVAQMPHSTVQPDTTEQPGQFRQVDQPLWLKATVTAGGVGLIGLELWWFLFSKPKSRKIP